MNPGYLVTLLALVCCWPAWTAESRPQAINLTSDNFSDLAFLRPLLAGKRIVQLGENSHGIHEYNLLKDRLVRFLHQELGYRVLAFESSLFQCDDVDRQLATQNPQASMAKSVFGVWHTEGVLPIFAYLQQTQASPQPMRLMGFDIQPIGNNKRHRPDFLARVVAAFDKSYAQEVKALDQSFLTEYAKGSRARRSFFRSEAGQAMAAAYGRLRDQLSGKAGSRDLVIARQIAFSMAAYIRQQSAATNHDHVHRRDHGMAQNLIALAEEIYPNEKIVVWAHNFHIRHANQAIEPDPDLFPGVRVETMGHWLKKKYAGEIYTIGFYAFQGQAHNNRGKVFDITPAAAGSLEGLLKQTGHKAAFLEVGKLPPESPFAQPLTARYNGETPLTMNLAEQYHAVIVIDRATPSRVQR